VIEVIHTNEGNVVVGEDGVPWILRDTTLAVLPLLERDSLDADTVPLALADDECEHGNLASDLAARCRCFR
jgi:hypothetical protein